MTHAGAIPISSMADDPTLKRPQGPVAPIATAPRPIDPGVTFGHVHLRTADIDRAGASPSTCWASTW